MPYMYVLGQSEDIVTTITNNSNAIAAIFGGIVSIFTVFKGFIMCRKHVHRKYIVPFTNRLAKIDAISETLGPNGGKSLYDRIAKMDEKISTTDIRGQNISSILDLYEWQLDINGLCTHVNASLCRLLNRQESDFIGSNWIDIICGEYRQEFMGEWNSAFIAKRKLTVLSDMCDFDGKTVKMKIVFTPLIDSCKECKGWFCAAKIHGEN